jgi:tetratricopeptide (TPR) repeat protein
MHGLVRRWVRENTMDPHKTRSNFNAMIAIVTSSLAKNYINVSAEQLAYERQTLPHIECCFKEFISQQEAGNPNELDTSQRDIAYQFAKVYLRLGRVRNFEALHQKMRGEKLTGIWQREMMYLLGRNLYLAGQFKEALVWYEAALEGTDWNSNESLYLKITQHKANVHKELGQYLDAIKLCERVLASPARTPLERLAMLELKRTLGLIDRLNGNLKRARELLDGVYADPSLGPDHPLSLLALHDIGMVLEAQGDFKGALDNLNTVLEKQKSILGENHLSTLDTMHTIGCVYDSMGEYEEAVKRNDEVLKRYGDHDVSRTHPWILYTMSTQANLLTHLGKYDEALQVYQKAYDGFTEQGINGPGAYPTATNLSRVLREKGRYKETLEWGKKALKGFEKEKFEENHPHTVRCKYNLGETLELQGKYAEALVLLIDVYETEKAEMGDNHKNTFENLSAIASVLSKQGDFEQAADDYRKAWEGLKSTIGGGHEKTLYAAQ